MKMYYLNPYTDAAEVVDVEDSLGVFYDMLDCTTIDIVSRKIGGKRFDIICDDEGTFVDDAHISAINDLGSMMLVGALLVCRNDGEGALVGLDDDDIKHIERFVRHQGTRRHPEGWRMLHQVEY